jgi:hypothetical protein
MSWFPSPPSPPKTNLWNEERILTLSSHQYTPSPDYPETNVPNSLGNTTILQGARIGTIKGSDINASQKYAGRDQYNNCEPTKKSEERSPNKSNEAHGPLHVIGPTIDMIDGSNIDVGQSVAGRDQHNGPDSRSNKTRK